MTKQEVMAELDKSSMRKLDSIEYYYNGNVSIELYDDGIQITTQFVNLPIRYEDVKYLNVGLSDKDILFIYPTHGSVIMIHLK